MRSCDAFCCRPLSALALVGPSKHGFSRERFPRGYSYSGLRRSPLGLTRRVCSVRRLERTASVSVDAVDDEKLVHRRAKMSKKRVEVKVKR